MGLHYPHSFGPLYTRPLFNTYMSLPLGCPQFSGIVCATTLLVSQISVLLMGEGANSLWRPLASGIPLVSHHHHVCTLYFFSLSSPPVSVVLGASYALFEQYLFFSPSVTLA